MTEPLWTMRLGSVRVRTTLAATLIVALTLSLGAWVATNRFRDSLENSQHDAALSRAVNLADLALAGDLPSVLTQPDQNTAFAQVIGKGGTVIAASSNITGEPAVGPLVSPRSHAIVRTVNGSVVGQDGRLQLVVLPARYNNSPVTVYAAYSLRTSDFALHDFERSLLIGLPLLLMVIAGTTWIIVGAALKPIASIRTEVAEITAKDLSRRVPVPRSDDELARLARTMNTMLARLETSVERQRVFVADASHELRSPLTSLRTQLEIGLALGSATDWTSTAAGALTEEARIEKLITDLLLLARLDSNSLIASSSIVSLQQVVSDDLASRPIREHVTVRSTFDGPALVAMEISFAGRVVANLVDNAQRYAHTEVVVAVRTSSPSHIELVITDDGSGIAAEDRERVFERFTRLDDSRSVDEGGAGLGLAIVRDIVERHGGVIAFTDCSRGTCVVVRLPVVNVLGE